MSWLEKILPKSDNSRRHNIPEGVWTKCGGCEQVLYKAEVERSVSVCPKCGHHMRIGARARLERFLDVNNRSELGAELEPQDILKFKDSKKYKDRLQAAQKETNEKDALIVIKGTVKGVPVVACAFEFSFMGGSMGTVVGDRFIQAAERAIQLHQPLICFAASGGARMQEGMLSLMQMARTSAAIQKMKEARVPYLVVLTHPVYGGVTASLAMLGDVHIAEPKAMIGFAGKRVIEQTVREKLEEPFQRAEYLLDHGVVDQIVHRHALRDTVYRLVAKLMNLP